MRSPESARHMMPQDDKDKKDSKPIFDIDAESEREVRSPEFSDAEIDEAFENVTAGEMRRSPAEREILSETIKGPETKFTMTPKALAAKESLKIVEVLMKPGGAKGLAGLKAEFLSQVPEDKADEAMAELGAALKQQHEVYFDLGKTELASEIDSFSRSLESSTEAKTAGGKDYLKKLESGGFTSLEDAINALDGLAKGAKTQDEQEAMNAEFNALFAAAQEKFAAGGSYAETGNLDDIGEGEIDELFGGLEKKDTGA